MRTSILVIAAWSLTLAWVNAKPASDEPFLFEPLPTPARMQLSQAAAKGWIFHALDLSERGDFVVLSAGSTAVDVWSVQTGAKTASMTLSTSDRSYPRAALVGDPCVVVAGHIELVDPSENDGLKKTPLKLASCATGETIATVAERELPRGALMALTGVPA